MSSVNGVFGSNGLLKDPLMTSLELRFKDFSKILVRLESSLKKDLNDEDNLALIVKYYELAFELFWKALKGYLHTLDIHAKNPRDVIKEGLENKIITGNNIWLEMLKVRNELTHVYDLAMARSYIQEIKDDFVVHFKEFESVMKELLDEA
jgi:nucleotidyltransferase substrate binding protein (TIGR01987 family)